MRLPSARSAIPADSGRIANAKASRWKARLTTWLARTVTAAAFATAAPSAGETDPAKPPPVRAAPDVTHTGGLRQGEGNQTQATRGGKHGWGERDTREPRARRG